jgi:DNA-binding NtrC family response regulator
MKILLVDDERGINRVLISMLESLSDVTVCYVEDVENAIKALEEEKFDVIITDLLIPGAKKDVWPGGFVLLEYIEEKLIYHNCEIIVQSAWEDADFSSFSFIVHFFIRQTGASHDIFKFISRLK